MSPERKQSSGPEARDEHSALPRTALLLSALIALAAPRMTAAQEPATEPARAATGPSVHAPPAPGEPEKSVGAPSLALPEPKAARVSASEAEAMDRLSQAAGIELIPVGPGPDAPQTVPQPASAPPPAERHGRDEGPEPASTPVIPASPAPRAWPKRAASAALVLALLSGASGALWWQMGDDVEKTPTPPAIAPKPNAAAPAVPPPTAEPVGEGTLHLWIEPWAQVRIDGEDFGLTPIPDPRLEAGPHELDVINEDLGLSWSGVIEIEANALTSVRLDLASGAAPQIERSPLAP